MSHIRALKEYLHLYSRPAVFWWRYPDEGRNTDRNTQVL